MNVRLNKKHKKHWKPFLAHKPQQRCNGGGLKPFSWHWVLQKRREVDRQLILNLEEKLPHFTDHIPEKRQGGIKLDVQETFSEK